MDFRNQNADGSGGQAYPYAWDLIHNRNLAFNLSWPTLK